jgi:hypothetical protein
MHDVPPLTTRAALAQGMTRDLLRSKRWITPFRGVRLPAAGVNERRQRCRALIAVTRGTTTISDDTAAELYAWWLASPDPRIHITVSRATVVDRPGVCCHRRRLDAGDATEVAGIRVTTPTRTIADLASTLCLIDLVVLIDSALQTGSCSRAELDALIARRGTRGIRTLRRAVALSDGRSESPMETLTRLVIVLSGLPAPIPQVEIFDIHGFLVARGDLKVPGVPAIFEYDGAIHNEPANHAKDVERWRAARAVGVEVFPYTARDLFQAPHRIVTDYQRVLGLPIDPLAVRGWWLEWQKSAFKRRPTGAE